MTNTNSTDTTTTTPGATVPVAIPGRFVEFCTAWVESASVEDTVAGQVARIIDGTTPQRRGKGVTYWVRLNSEQLTALGNLAAWELDACRTAYEPEVAAEIRQPAKVVAGRVREALELAARTDAERAGAR